MVHGRKRQREAPRVDAGETRGRTKIKLIAWKERCRDVVSQLAKPKGSKNMAVVSIKTAQACKDRVAPRSLIGYTKGVTLNGGRRCVTSKEVLVLRQISGDAAALPRST